MQPTDEGREEATSFSGGSNMGILMKLQIICYCNMNLEQFIDTKGEYYYYYGYQSCTILLCHGKGVRKGSNKEK